MFIPCDHCLRKNATHVSEVNDRGEPEPLRLCKACHERLKQDLAHRPPFSPDPGMTIRQLEEAIAQELQANLLPSRIPAIPGYDFSAFFRPSGKVRGDYYDLFEIRDGRLGLLVADGSGMSIPGVIAMTETRALLKSEALRTASPAETLARVNRVLYGDIKRGMFVTLYYAVLEVDAATLTCVSAGHNPMMLWRKAANTQHLVSPNGLALGIDKGPLFEKTLKELKVQLSPGDRFTFYTDGVVEAMNGRNESFGQQRFYGRAKQLADLSSADFLRFLMREIDRHRGDAPQHDDIAIVTGRYKGPS